MNILYICRVQPIFLHNNNINKSKELLNKDTNLFAVTEQEQRITNPMLGPLILHDKIKDYKLCIRLGPNCCRNIDLHSISELYRSGHEKVLFNTNDLNWNQIIRNTNINDSNREAIQLLAEQWIRDAEIVVVNALIQPSLKLELNVDRVKKYVLTLSNRNNYLLTFKKYQEKNIFLSLNCEKSRILYSQIYHKFLRQGKLLDHSFMYIVLFLLWYV